MDVKGCLDDYIEPWEIVRLLLDVLKGEQSRDELMEKLSLRDREHFRKEYLHPALASGLIEMTIPDKPRSSKQKYRLTTAH